MAHLEKIDKAPMLNQLTCSNPIIAFMSNYNKRFGSKTGSIFWGNWWLTVAAWFDYYFTPIFQKSGKYFQSFSLLMLYRPCTSWNFTIAYSYLWAFSYNEFSTTLAIETQKHWFQLVGLGPYNLTSIQVRPRVLIYCIYGCTMIMDVSWLRMLMGQRSYQIWLQRGVKVSAKIGRIFRKQKITSNEGE